MKPLTPLITFAMQEESRGLFDDYLLLHTGIGKVNAAKTLSKAIYRNRPDVIINLGTAGSHVHTSGTVVNITGFVQRDMDVTALGVPRYQTPFSEKKIILRHALALEHYPQATIGTGDNFAVSTDVRIPYDVVDMEAYAIADICEDEDIPLLCLKYISDGADDTASDDWRNALLTAGQHLRRALDEIMPKLPAIIDNSVDF